MAYTFGFRKGELLGMRCQQVDLLNNTISLYSGQTKNDEGRTVVLTNECRALVTELRKGKQPEDFLFTREDGCRVIDFRGAWDALVVAAGLPGLIFHDFRRSAVLNMVRAGIPERVAMKISGHKTRSVFERYNIVSEADIADAARRIEAGAQAVSHSYDIVDPESRSETQTQNEQKLYNERIALPSPSGGTGRRARFRVC